MIYVAIAYWCSDCWVIAAGHDREAVIRDAIVKVKVPRSDFVVAEGYDIKEIEESK